MSDTPIEHHNSERTRTAGAPFTAAVLDDRYAYLSGIVAADIPGGDEVLGDIEAETELVLGTIEAMLADLGLGMDRIVQVNLHMADFDEFQRANDVYRRFFEEGRYPARTSTQSSKLFGGSRIEITCVARLRDG